MDARPQPEKRMWGFFQRLKPYFLGVFLFWIWLAFKDSPIPDALEGSIIVILFGLVMWREFRQNQSTGWSISWFTVIFIVYIVYAGLLVSRTPLHPYSLDKVFELSSLLFLFLFFRQEAKNQDDTTMWQNALLGTTFLLLVLEFSTVVIWHLSWIKISGSVFQAPPLGFRFTGAILTHPNIIAGILNIIFPLVLMRLMLTNSKRKRALYFVAILFIGVNYYYTSSRSGWIAGVAGLGITLIFFYGSELFGIIRQRQTNRISLLSTNRKLFATLAILAVGSLAYLFIQQSLNTPGHFGLLSGREKIWQNSVTIWGRSPIWGNGPGTFPLYYSLQAMLPPGFLAGHAHNLWLQIGAETGVIGVLLVLGMTLALGHGMFQWAKTGEKDKNLRGNLAAYIGVGTAVLVQHFAVYLFHDIFYTVSVLLIVALILRDNFGGKQLTIPKKVGLPVILTIIGFYVIGLWINFPAYYTYNKGAIASWEDDLLVSQQSICWAAQSKPLRSVYAFQCGLTSAQTSRITGDSDFLELAISMYKQGLEIDPYWPVHLANLSLLEWEKGNEKEAISYMREATQMAPRNELFAINLGWMSEQIGNSLLAVESYESAIQSDPWLQESPYFQKTPIRKRVLENRNYDDLLNVADRFNIEAYREINAGNLNSALTSLNSAIESDPSNAETFALQGLAALLLGEPDEAWKKAQTAVFLDSTNPRVLIWASQVAIGEGKHAEAQRYLEKAFVHWINVNESYNFYGAFYHVGALQTDIVPGYQRADVIPEMEKSFSWFADQFILKGEPCEGSDTFIWLEILGLN